MFYNPFVSDPEKYRFESIYRNDAAGWDIGRPQDPVRYIVESGQMKGKVLDIGCGTGLHSCYMASKGLEVYGIDFSSEAIHKAKQRAYSEGCQASFLVWDALKLSELNAEFDTVLDSAMMHCLTQSQRADYVNQLQKVLRTGGRAFIICSQSTVPVWEVEALFSDWKILYIMNTHYSYTGSSIPAYLICAEKK